MSDTEYFVREAVGHARKLPCADAICYLRGMLALTNGAKEMTPVRQAFNDLRDCDQQLELIASGRLKLPLAAEKGRS